MGALITRTSGSSVLVDGQSVSISGSGFGTNSVTQAFAGGVNGPIQGATANSNISNSSGGSNLALGGVLTWAGGDPQFASDAQTWGGRSIMNRYGYNVATGGTYNSSLFQYGFRADFGARVFATYWRTQYYISIPGGTPQTGQVKHERYTGQPGVNSGLTDDAIACLLCNMYPSASSNGQTQRFSAGPALSNISEGGPGWVLDGWIQREYMLVPGSQDGTDGTFAWRHTRLSDNTVIASGSQTGLTFWQTGDISMRSWVMQNQFHNAAGVDGSVLWIGRDFYCSANLSNTTKPKFLLLGDASTYAACVPNKMVIQKTTSWSDTSISFTLNKGQLSSLSGVYAYAMSDLNTPINSNGIIPS